MSLGFKTVAKGYNDESQIRLHRRGRKIGRKSKSQGKSERKVLRRLKKMKKDCGQKQDIEDLKNKVVLK